MNCGTRHLPRLATGCRPVRSKAAFSIPEMLAVIAIIVILISLLMPSYRLMRQAAQAAVCRSNLHQIGLMSLSYCHETGFMPTGYTGADIVWVPELYPHGNNDPSIFYCPSAPAKAVWNGPAFGSGLPAIYGYKQDQMRIKTSEFFSYGHNNGGSSDGSNPSLGVGDLVNGGALFGGWNPRYWVKSGASFIMYGDSTVDGLWDHFIDEDYENGLGPTEYPADRHNEGANIVFYDAHVEWILQVNLWHLGSVGTALPENRRRWNNDNQPH